MKVMYDHDIAVDGNDPLVEIAETAIGNINLACSPGWMVDLVPARTRSEDPIVNCSLIPLLSHSKIPPKVVSRGLCATGPYLESGGRTHVQHTV